jgi:hypothetical protein
MANAQMRTKIIYYCDRKTGEILMGLPECFAAPPGYEKIVCNNAYEAERWSALMRKWDEVKHQVIQEKREAIEGPMRKHLREEMFHNMANARNTINREFLRIHLEHQDKKQNPWEYKRKSFLGAEGFENVAK